MSPTLPSLLVVEIDAKASGWLTEAQRGSRRESLPSAAVRPAEQSMSRLDVIYVTSFPSSFA